MIQEFINLTRTLTTPERLIDLLSSVLTGWWAYLILFIIVFSETGLLIGVVLPGDSLLFALGVVAGAGKLDIGILVVVLCVAAVLGDSFGYALGRNTGPMIFNKPDSRFFKKEYVYKTQKFFEKYGGKTIIFARFLPVVRSFAPFLAGVGQMNYNHFLIYNIVGALAWVFIMVFGGYFLGNVEWVRANFEKVIFAVIFASFLPVIFEYLRNRWKKQA